MNDLQNTSILSYILPIISAITGGFIKLPATENISEHLAAFINAASPDLTSFFIQCGQAFVFAVIGGVVKLGFDRISKKNKREDDQ